MGIVGRLAFHSHWRKEESDKERDKFYVMNHFSNAAKNGRGWFSQNLGYRTSRQATHEGSEAEPLYIYLYVYIYTFGSPTIPFPGYCV